MREQRVDEARLGDEVARQRRWSTRIACNPLLRYQNSFVADAGGTRIKLALMRDGTVLAQDCIAAHSGEGLAPQLPRIEQGLDALCRTAGMVIP